MSKRVTVTKADVNLATRVAIKASIGIDGLSGDGKTGLALEFAHAFEKDWSKIYAIDSENNSLSQYVGLPLQSDGEIVGQFHHAKLNKDTGYSIFNYEFFRKDAYKENCTVCIQDSFTHPWNREGGILQRVNQITDEDPRGNKYVAWGNPDIVDGKNLIFDLIRDHKVHVISTLRIKDDYGLVAGDNGSMTVKNFGLKQQQSEGLQYEFDLLLRMERPASTINNTPARVEVLKSRYRILEKGEYYDMTKELISSIFEYINEGTSPEEINEKLKEELVEGLRKRSKEKKILVTIFKEMYPNKKLNDLTLNELRKVNSKFVEIESS